MEGGFFYRRRRFQIWKRNSNMSGLFVTKCLDGFVKIPEESYYDRSDIKIIVVRIMSKG